MSNTNMNIRMDSEIKKQAEKLFSEFGLNMTSAINLFLRQAIREQSIPFEISLYVPNAETRKAIDDVKKRKNLSRSFHTVEDLMEDLNTDD